MITTEDVAKHDQCERLRSWSAAFSLPVIPLAQALHESLRVGLVSGDPSHAKDKLMALAADPGLELAGWNVFDQVVHHAALLEIICAYLLGNDGAWKPAEAVSCGSFGFKPLSYLLPDGRLRRVVLASAWSTLRDQEEKTSWRTVADTVATNRPMLINLIVIGQSRKGFRSTPWTTGFKHPENGILRVKRIATEKTGPNPKFSDGWSQVYREQTDHKPKEWLTIMQKDQAFDGMVQYYTVDVPPNRKEVLADLGRIEREIESGDTTMRRSACFRFAPCVFAGVCHKGLTPENAGFKRETKVGCLV